MILLMSFILIAYQSSSSGLFRKTYSARYQIDGKRDAWSFIPGMPLSPGIHMSRYRITLPQSPRALILGACYPNALTVVTVTREHMKLGNGHRFGTFLPTRVVKSLQRRWAYTHELLELAGPGLHSGS
ncbi:hypothetical protein OG21DRAFT_1313509 [Imleria badia]|nr:hypothetical protein OG21DRAFT_1313509 [Imleria badia]